MALTKEQLQLLDSCPVFAGLKDWIIAIDNSVNPTPVTPQDDDGEEEYTPQTYSFTSYGDDEGETEWGTGTVETTGVVTNGFTEVEVKTNSTDQEFVGQKFFISSEAEADGNTLYPLYSDAGETAAGIYVKISSE